MTYRITLNNRLYILAIGLALALLAAPAAAQERPHISTTPDITEITTAKIVLAPVEGQIEPGAIKVNTLPPIAFKPFEMLDPQTGRPISPDAMLTLPDGKRITAREYYSQVNRLEQGFNQLGYTLRQTANVRTEKLVTPTGTIDVVRLQQVPLDESRLQVQSQQIKTQHTAFNPSTMAAPASFAALTAGQQSHVRNLASVTGIFNGNPLTASKVKVNETRSWNYSLGNPSTFSAHLNGKITLTGDATVQNISGEANAGGSIFNHSKDILRATASVHAPASGVDMTAKLNVNVLGTTVFNLDKHFNATPTKPLLTESNTITPKAIDFSKTIHFSIGPIPISVKVGAQGSVALSYFLSVASMSVKAQAVPKIRSNVYVQAGVGIIIARAGATASLTLVNDDLTLGGELAIKFDEPLKGPYFAVKYYGLNNFEALKGSVSAFACIYLPSIRPPFFKEHCYDTTLFSFGGFKVNGFLFNVQKKLFLFQPPVVSSLVQ
ncbi:MAG: hypothetical protein ACJ74G_21420 [Blastocatellia bacterium]